MKHNIILFFSVMLFLISPDAISQTKAVRGQLLSPQGEPLVGVTIMIKGTTTGTVSDIDGNYSIDAPVNGILVFSYIGFNTTEASVLSLIDNATDYSKIKIKKKKPETNWEGFLSINDSMDKSKFIINVSSPPKNQLKILKKYDPYTYNQLTGRTRSSDRTRIMINFKSTFSINQVAKLPEFQNEYSQGRNAAGNLIWQGPEYNERFSWGPSLQTLEYDGLPYEYDKNGRIVERGTGNGMLVSTYDPKRFFQNSLSHRQSLSFIIKKEKMSLKMVYHYTNEKGIIPNTSLSKNNIQFNFKTSSITNLDINFNVMATLADANLLSGFSQSHIMQSVFQTPLTFDNANGLSSSEAVENSSSYTLPNNQHRSYAPDSSNNPYWLINNITDHEKSNWLQANIDLKYQLNNWFSALVTGSIEKQNSKDEFGFSQGKVDFIQGQLSSRTNNLISSYFRAGLKFHKNTYDWEYTGNLYYELVYLDRNILRPDISTVETEFELKNLRTVHAIVPHFNLSYQDIIIGDFSARGIFSSTLTKNYFKPTIAVAFIPTNINLIHLYWLNFFKLFGSFSSGLNETPLGFKRGLFNSTIYSSSEYSQYYETAEVIHPQSLKPELTDRWEIGANIGFFYNRLVAEFSLYKGNTKQVLIPVYTGEHFTIENGCDIQSKGYDLEISFRNNIYRGVQLLTTLTLSKNISTVNQVYNPSNQIIIGGFDDVPVALVEGQPYGVILGNSYQYNDNGQLLVGNDGFPLVDNNLKIIGNPNPDWIMGWSNEFSYKGFELMITFDIKKGGDVWNGTKNTLNYLGLSKESGDQRGISSYIFEGVLTDGSPNLNSVSFYDPSLPLEENRWVRYGSSGVASEAIEDGSWIRLSELRFAYSIRSKFRSRNILNRIRIEVFAKNLFVITRYSGVDPQTKVLGFNNNYGLDYFNTPGSRTYGASVEFRF